MFEMLPVALSVIGTVMGSAGAFAAGDAAELQGKRQRAAADFEAAQLTQQAGQAYAASQRTSLEQIRQGTYAESHLQALAAASGAGTGGNVLDLASNLHAEASYRSSIALYQGEEKRRQLMMGAQAKTYEGFLAEESGASKKQAYDIAGTANLFKGAASLYTLYGGGGPGKTAPVESRSFDSTSSIGVGGINWDEV